MAGLFESLSLWAYLVIAVVVLGVGGFVALTLRRVVPTNEVHIVQTAKITTSYGKDQPAGNAYYSWPSWLPVWGLNVSVLPVSVFAIDLEDYEAYDKERVPFLVNVKAFFRIADSNTAAQRVASFSELAEQLEAIVQGAVRTTLAKHDIDSIMSDRSIFGEFFTNEVEAQLKNWGVETVKNIELMDIRDSQGSKVIANIMAKRTSEIEKDSRLVVAENTRQAQIAEISAQRDIDLQKQEALQQVGQRTAQKEREVGIANELMTQEVLQQQRETKTRAMAVQQVEQTRQAEIAREVSLVKADEQQRVAIIQAEGHKKQTIITAEAALEAQRRSAEGIAVEGQAKAEAEKAMQMVPVQTQITLAQEIGNNAGYQTYLLRQREIEANQAVGIEQAKALNGAEIKVITNAGTPSEGLTKVMDLFSSRGGTAVGAALEALAQTDTGKAVLDKITSQE